MRNQKSHIGKIAWSSLLCVMILSALVFIDKSVCKASTIPTGYTPIYTVEDLYGINNDLNGKYILMNDIDLSETKPGGEWDAGNGWTPIGTDMSDLTNCLNFTGIFDGNGYRIENMTIYGKGNIPSCVGLFASVEGTIKNVALENINIVIDDWTDFCIGGITGVNYGNIESCYVTGSLQCKDARSIGGIVGSAHGNESRSDVNNCYSDVNINVSNDFNGHSGGIIGYNCYGNVINCYAIGNIELNGSDVPRENIGAVAGFDYDELEAYGWSLGEKNCYYMGTLTDQCAKRLSKAQMKSAKCFTGFDFKKAWVVDVNSSYPYPQLQNCMQVRTESIQLLSEPDKTSYCTTDKLNLSGSELKINYEDNYSVTVPLTEEMLTYKMAEGTQTVKVAYNGCTAEFDIDVKKAPESLKITSKKTKLKVGSSYTYKAKYLGIGKLTFTSSNSKVLKIDKTTGKAVAKKAGTVTITVKGGSLIKKIKVKIVK